jgi:PST family polysaccharide transporter
LIIVSRSENFARFAGTEAASGDLKRKSVLGALTTGASGGVDFVLRLGSTMVLARLLVPEHFGMVAMVTALTSIAARFTTLGLSTATVQAPEITDGQCSNLFWINTGAGALLAAILVLSCPAIAWFYEDARLQAITVALSLNFVCTGLTVQHEALLRRQMKLTQIAGNRLAATFFSVCLAIGLALGGFGYWALVWKEVIQAFLIAVGVWTLCPWLPRLPSRRVNMDRLLRFGRDMTLTELLLALSAQLDSVLIGRLAGAGPLGLYRQAYNLMQAPMERVRGPIFTVAQPALSILQREPPRYRRYYQRVVFVVSLATVPFGVLTAIYAHEIVLVVLGEKWLGAVVFLRIFSVVAAVRPALGTCGIVQVTCGKSGRFLGVTLAYQTVEVILMFAGIRWGAVGIAAARAVTLILGIPWVLRFSFAETPVSVRDFFQACSRPVVASLTMGAVLLLVQHFVHVESALLSLLIGCGSAVIVYFLVFNVLPGGRGQLQSLASELLAPLRRRSSKGIEASK